MKAPDVADQGLFLAEEFILWLWMQGLTTGGLSGRPDDKSACFVDDHMVLASERGDVKILTLAKGNPAESREAFEAMSRGMRPVNAKVRILAGDMEWVFTLAASGLQVSGAKLPPTQSKDMAGRFADRMFLIEELQSHLDRRFAHFLGIRISEPAALEAQLKDWIKQGLGVAA